MAQMEKVMTVFDWWSGPVCGIANYKGVPCIYERIFDEVKDEWSDEYYLTPIGEDAVNILLGDWEIWCEAVRNGKPLTSYYALPDRKKYFRIVELSEQKRAYKRAAVFRGQIDKGFIPVDYYVEWIEK